MKPITVMLFVVFLFSCSEPVTYKSEVKELGELIENVKESQKEFLNIDFSEAKKRLNQINSTIDFVKENIGDEIEKEDALLLDKYRGTKSFIKRFSERSTQVRTEYERTLSQLENLKEALSTGATHDKNQEEISKEYVTQNMIIEREAASNLMKNSEELKERSTKFLLVNQEKLDALQPFLDSLK